MPKQETIFLNQGNIGGFVNKASTIGVVALDTEFSKSRSYFAKLSLIQLSFGDNITYIYDFLDKDLDPKPILDLLSDKGVLKVLHAVSQDGEAVKYAFGIDMGPVVDTQVMARELGIGQQVSYSFLVKKFFGVLLDKEYQYSNWMQRPLGDEKVLYASIDVYYLLDLYAQMKTMMTTKQMEESIEGSRAALLHGLRRKDPIVLWKQFRRSKFLGRDASVNEPVAKSIFLFREYLAKQKNVLPKMIMTDAHILALSSVKDLSLSILNRITNLPPYVDASGLLDLIFRSQAKSKNSRLAVGRIDSL